MGKVKEWAETEWECVVCGKLFFPYETIHEVDPGVPTCSRACYSEYANVMECIADIRDDEFKCRPPSS